MISKCSTVILKKRKFSEFEDGDLNDKSLFVVGYQDIDGERENVKISVADLLDRRNGDRICVVDLLDSTCPHPVEGSPYSVEYCPCAKCFVFNVEETGNYIQINNINDADWNERSVNGETKEYFINIAFSNAPIGSIVKLYLPNFGRKSSYAEVDAPCRVYLYQIAPEEMEKVSTSNCPLCDIAAGQRVSRFIDSFPMGDDEGEGRLKREYYDFFTRFICLTTVTKGTPLKLMRVVDVTNIYDGNWAVDGEDIP